MNKIWKKIHYVLTMTALALSVIFGFASLIVFAGGVYFPLATAVLDIR